ncbi:hypothetical protein BT69DRAFT_1321782 [Atractiella rhizophila]|nr:hypothetical protein BT69DRAFT_1321782 [Atractiella rhizophila]
MSLPFASDRSAASPRLPYDIFHQITSFCPPSTLSLLCLTDASFYHSASRRLYGSIGLNRAANAALLLSVLRTVEMRRGQVVQLRLALETREGWEAACEILALLSGQRLELLEVDGLLDARARLVIECLRSGEWKSVKRLGVRTTLPLDSFGTYYAWKWTDIFDALPSFPNIERLELDGVYHSEWECLHPSFKTFEDAYRPEGERELEMLKLRELDIRRSSVSWSVLKRLIAESTELTVFTIDSMNSDMADFIAERGKGGVKVDYDSE